MHTNFDYKPVVQGMLKAKAMKYEHGHDASQVCWSFAVAWTFGVSYLVEVSPTFCLSTSSFAYGYRAAPQVRRLQGLQGMASVQDTGPHLWS